MSSSAGDAGSLTDDDMLEGLGGDEGEGPDQRGLVDFIAGRGDVIEREPFHEPHSDRWMQRFGRLSGARLFLELITRELVQYITEATNMRLKEDETPVSYGEVVTYLAVLVAQAIFKLADEKHYWRNDEDGLISYPNFSKAIAYRRFLSLRSKMKYTKSAPQPRDKMWKATCNYRPTKIFPTHNEVSGRVPEH